jgi:hypothetical protein
VTASYPPPNSSLSGTWCTTTDTSSPQALPCATPSRASISSLWASFSVSTGWRSPSPSRYLTLIDSPSSDSDRTSASAPIVGRRPHRADRVGEVGQKGYRSCPETGGCARPVVGRKDGWRRPSIARDCKRWPVREDVWECIWYSMRTALLQVRARRNLSSPVSVADAPGQTSGDVPEGLLEWRPVGSCKIRDGRAVTRSC